MPNKMSDAHDLRSLSTDSTTSMSATASRTSKFLNLPPEIRNNIYEHATFDIAGSLAITLCPVGLPRCPLLHINKQIRAEFLGVLCHERSIYLGRDRGDWSELDALKAFLAHYDENCPASTGQLRLYAVVWCAEDRAKFIATICRWRWESRQQKVDLELCFTTFDLKGDNWAVGKNVLVARSSWTLLTDSQCGLMEARCCSTIVTEWQSFIS